ncbi:MAG: hypothetical protein V4547_16210 [Bacteroidota bacterium]
METGNYVQLKNSCRVPALVGTIISINYPVIEVQYPGGILLFESKDLHTVKSNSNRI